MTGASGGKDLSLLVFQLRAKVFCTLCEKGSFSETGRILGISQSAASRHVAELEEDLAVTLFDRAVRPVRPTAAGLSLYRLLSKALAGIEASLAELRANNALLPPARLGFVESIARSMSWAVVNQLKSSFSIFSVQTGISAYLLRLMDEDRLDAIVCPDPFANRNDLERRFIFREPSVVVLPKDSGLPEALTWERLLFSGLPILQYAKENSGGQLQQKLFGKLHLEFVHRIEVDINALLLDYVAHGVGWALTRPTTLIQHPDLASQVDVRPMPEPVVARELYVITKAGRHAELACGMAKILSEEFRTVLAPKMKDIAPWTAPYLYVAGEKESDREPVFPGEARDTGVYVL